MSGPTMTPCMHGAPMGVQCVACMAESRQVCRLVSLTAADVAGGTSLQVLWLRDRELRGAAISAGHGDDVLLPVDVLRRMADAIERDVR